MAGADDLAPAGNGSAVRHIVDIEGVRSLRGRDGVPAAAGGSRLCRGGPTAPDASRGADLLGLEIGLGDHERVLSFAEECELALVNTDATSGDERADAAAPIELAGG